MKYLVAKMLSLVFVTIFMLGCNSESNVLSSENDGDLLKPGKPGNELGTLSQEEIDGLIHMRIEEKLARDVYTVLGNKWQAKVFLNIKLSEQNHMDAINRLMIRYGIPDPLTTDEVGVFPNETFQNLYNELVAQGSLSLVEAFKVGVKIEELDIDDLEYQIENVVNNIDILRVYTNLKIGSENHLKAFNRNLTFVCQTQQ
ncbi:MAG: DUF2202 domain-containing protein [Ignavibacteriaceae bacterium]|nr:DUF2202 domain-containing protein [Ignavibacteriaceae bacterium]